MASEWKCDPCDLHIAMQTGNVGQRSALACPNCGRAMHPQPVPKRGRSRRRSRQTRYSDRERFWLSISSVGAVCVFLLGMIFLMNTFAPHDSRSDSAAVPTAIGPAPGTQPAPITDLPDTPSPFQTVEVVENPMVPVLAEEPLSDLIERVERSVVRIDVEGAEGETNGSGFVIDSAGTIVTNAHVLDGAATASVVFSDDARFPIRGYNYIDEARDLMLLVVDLPADRRIPLALAASAPRKGDPVLACGSPYGLSFTASEGIVSALRTSEELKNLGVHQEGMWVQTTAPISPGSSGGPLIDRSGNVIAVNTMQLEIGQNLNFGISANDLADALRQPRRQLQGFEPPSPQPMQQATKSAPTAPETRPTLKSVIGTELADALLAELTTLRLSVVTPPDEETAGEAITERVHARLRSCGLRIVPGSEAMLLVAWKVDRSAKPPQAALISKLFVTRNDLDPSGEPWVLVVWESIRPVPLPKNSTTPDPLSEAALESIDACFRKLRDDLDHVRHPLPNLP